MSYCDGSIIGLVENNGNLYLSEDGGNSWGMASEDAHSTLVSITTPQSWQKIRMSNDGETIVSVSDGGISGSGNIFIGNAIEFTTINQPTIINKPWKSVDISGDGNTIVAVADKDFIYVGNSTIMTSKENKRRWKDIKISGDGSTIIACATGVAEIGRAHV